jgi:hypothetical protein
MCIYLYTTGTESVAKPTPVKSAKKANTTVKPAATTAASTTTSTAPAQPATPMSVDSSSDDDEATDSDSGAVDVTNSSSGDTHTSSRAAAVRATLLDASNGSSSTTTAKTSARSGSGGSAAAAGATTAKAKPAAPVTTPAAAARSAPVTPTATAATGGQRSGHSSSGSSNSGHSSSGSSNSGSRSSGNSSSSSSSNSSGTKSTRFAHEFVAGDDSTSVPWQTTKAAAESTASTQQQQQQQVPRAVPAAAAPSVVPAMPAFAAAAAVVPSLTAAAAAQAPDAATASMNNSDLHKRRIALEKVHAAQSDLHECITATIGVRDSVRQLRQLCLRSTSSVAVAVVTAAYADDAVVPVEQLQCEFAAMTELLQRIRSARISVKTKNNWHLQLLLHSGMLGATAVAAGRFGNITDSAAAATALSLHALQGRLVQTIEQNSVVQQAYKDALIRGVLAVTDPLLPTAATDVAAAAAEPVSALRVQPNLREQLIAVVQAAAKALPEVRDMLTLRLLNATKAGVAASAQQQQLQQGGVAALNQLSSAALALHSLQQRALSHIDSCASSVRAETVQQWQLCVLTDTDSFLPQLMQSDDVSDGAYATELSKQQALIKLIDSSTDVSQHVRNTLVIRLRYAGVW